MGQVNVIDMLTEDHKVVNALLQHYDGSEGSGVPRSCTIIESLTKHTRIEETGALPLHSLRGPRRRRAHHEAERNTKRPRTPSPSSRS